MKLQFLLVIEYMSIIIGVLIGILISTLIIYSMYKQRISKIIYQQDAHSRKLFESLELPVLIMSKGKIYDVNGPAVSFFKAKNNDELIGLEPEVLIDESYHHYYHKRLKQIQTNKSANISANYMFKLLDGTRAYGMVYAEPKSFLGEMVLEVIILPTDALVNINQRLQKTERRNRDLILHTQEGIGVFKLIRNEYDATLVFSNRKFLEILTGNYHTRIYERFTVLFKRFLDGDIEDIFDKANQQVFEKDFVDYAKHKYYHAYFYLNLENELVVHLTDVTKEKSLIKSYLEDKNKLNDILAATDTIIWTWDRKTEKLSFQQRLLKRLNYDTDSDDFEDPTKLINYCHPDDKENFYNFFYNYKHKGKDYFSFEVRFRDVNNVYHWWLVRGQVVPNQLGEHTLVSGTAQDITSDKKNKEEISFLSMHDYLTKAYNYRAYAQKIVELDKDELMPISIALIDVDGLKVFNDAFNHSKGDELLLKTANTIRDHIKESDVLSRIGGDEFLVIMPKTSLEEAKMIFVDITNDLDKIKISGIPISISYGIEVKKTSELSLLKVKDMADTIMYQNKYNSSNIKIKILEKIRQHFFAEHDFERKVVERTHDLAMKLANQIELDEQSLHCLDIASQYYNIGVFSIRKEVFNNERSFEDVDLIEYKKHIESGYRLLLSTYQDESVARSVLHHHEKYNGEGYPSNLKGKDIPIASRIIPICATYSRMTQLGQTKEEVIRYLDNESNQTYDGELVKIFKKLI